MARWWLIAALILLAGCGGGSPEPRAAKAGSPARTPVLTGEPGRLVDIGGGRTLLVHCVGSGSPAVLLEAGFGGASPVWDEVLPALARTTKTCAYDRAGLGTSVGAPGVHDARDTLADLVRMLPAAHIATPVVVVGHSYGGLLARLFAHAHPGQVAGLVLVDSMGRNQTRREMVLWPRRVAARERRDFSAPVTDGVNLRVGEDLAGHVTSLGALPLAVVTAGRHPGDLPVWLAHRFDRLWTTMQDELATLSTDSVHVVALRSDHFVQGIAGQPGVVIRAARAVVSAVRDGTPLPACSAIFHGPGVRCRG